MSFGISLTLLAVAATCCVASMTAESILGVEAEGEILARDDECAEAGVEGCLSLAQLRGQVLATEVEEDVSKHLEKQIAAHASAIEGASDVSEVDAWEDKCMKRLWPDLADPCSLKSGYFDSCRGRVSGLASKYGGSCSSYCSSFGFRCSAGYVPRANTTGCSDGLSEATYLPCAGKTQSEEAICSCSDPMDTFLWKGAAKLCGSGRVLVRSARSCSDFCGQQGLACESAWPASGSGCSAGAPVGCLAPVGGAGALCECSGQFDRAGAFKWPDQKRLCDSGTVLVSGKALRRSGGSCGGYCKSLRGRVPGLRGLYFSCVSAWRADGSTGCSAYTQARASDSASDSCDDDMQGEDAVCACSFADL